MKLAVIADIHGNSSALRAVLADMETQGITEAVNLGDHFSGPLDAAGTASLLMQCDFPSIRGNHDRWLIEQEPAQMGPSDKVAHDQLEPEHFDWLRSLAPTRMYQGEIFMCHGTPNSDTTYWLERCDPSGQVRPATRAEVAKEAEGIAAQVILCAHTHIPRILHIPDGRMVLNPGSVGCPAYDDDHPTYHHMQTGCPNAAYAVLERSADAWTASLRSVPYPVDEMARRAERHGRTDWARALRTGWFEH